MTWKTHRGPVDALALGGRVTITPSSRLKWTRKETGHVPWKQQPLMPFMAKEDRLMGVIHEREEKKSRLVELGTRGTSGEKEWSLPEDWDVNQLVVYGFAVSANGQNASGTLGVTRN